jgi:hypothetical protein
MTYEWGRSCSLVYTGDQRDGFGYRDAIQDFLGVTAMIPDLVRERMLLMLSGQDSTGGQRHGQQSKARKRHHQPAAQDRRAAVGPPTVKEPCHREQQDQREQHRQAQPHAPKLRRRKDRHDRCDQCRTRHGVGNAAAQRGCKTRVPFGWRGLR